MRRQRAARGRNLASIPALGTGGAAAAERAPRRTPPGRPRLVRARPHYIFWIVLPLGDEPSPGALHAIYRHYRRRLAHALARGLALQIAIYGLERRVGPPSAAALRAAYPCLITPAPYFIRPRASPVSRPLAHSPLVFPQGETAGWGQVSCGSPLGRQASHPFACNT